MNFYGNNNCGGCGDNNYENDNYGGKGGWNGNNGWGGGHGFGGCGCDPCLLILILLLSNCGCGFKCDPCSLIWIILLSNCCGGCGGKQKHSDC